MPNGYPTYYEIFQQQQAAGQRMQLAQERMRQMRADALLRQMQFQSLDQSRNANELLQRQRLDYQVQRSQAQDASRQQADTTTDQIVNQTNPPAATAVTPPGGDPAWTMRANALRDRFFQDHPNLRPGPPQPYTGGATMLPHVRSMVAPQASGQDAITARMAASHSAAQRAALQKEIDAIRSHIAEVGPADQIEDSTTLYTVNKDKGTPQGTPYDQDGTSIYLNRSNPKLSGIVTPNFSNAVGTNDIRSMNSLMDAYRQLVAKKKALSALSPVTSDDTMAPANPPSTFTPLPPAQSPTLSAPATAVNGPTSDEVFDDEASARAAGHGNGDLIMMSDPATGQPRRARLR